MSAPETAKKLGALVNDIVKLDLKDYWLNVNFLDAYEKDSDKVLANLEQEYEQNLEASADVLKAAKLIDRMEHQIGQWAEPKNFKKLFEKELQPKIQEITNLIKLDEENKLSSNLAIKQLYRMVDAIDLSMKQLQNSPLYENKEQQVKNFRMMLGEFFQVMENQVEDLHPGRIQDMKGFLGSKRSSNIPSELLPSSDFSVINAGFFQDNDDGFSRGFSSLGSKNLADLYTLIHQTSLGSIATKSKNISSLLVDRLPEFVKTIDKKLLGDRSKVFKNYSTNNLRELQKLSLLYVEESYPYINLHYNIPLGYHSGNLILKYNVDKQSIELDYRMFGAGGRPRNNRWKSLEKHAFLLFESFVDGKLTDHKSDAETLNLKIEITKDTKNIEEIFQIFNTISHATKDYVEALDNAFDDMNSDIVKGMNEFGLSSFIINAHKDAEGNIDFKALHEVIEKLRNNSSKEIRSDLERESLMRLMAMDNDGVVDQKKLKEITREFKDKQLSASELAEGDLSKLSVYGYSVLAPKLAMEKDYSNAMKVVNSMISSGEKNLFVGRGIRNLGIVLIENDQIDDALYIANEVKDIVLLTEIAYKFAGKDDLENTFKLIDKMPSYNIDTTLSSIVVKLIEKDNLKNIFKIADRITEISDLSNIAHKFIEKNNFENSLKVVDKITKVVVANTIDRYRQSVLSEIAYKFIERGEFEGVLKIVDRITDERSLNNVAIKFIERDDLESASKIIDRITNGNGLSLIAIKFIEKDAPESSLKVIDKITYEYYLKVFAHQLIEKNRPSEAVKVIGKIKNPTQKQLEYVEKNSPKKEKSSDWLSLPVAEAIDERSYRKLDNDYAITEAERLDHLKSKAKDNYHSAPMDYQSFIDQHNPQGKLSGGNIPKTPNLPNDFNLLETDMNAVAVIGARAAKFFVNKLTAGEKNKIKEKKVKKQKKDKDIIR